LELAIKARSSRQTVFSKHYNACVATKDGTALAFKRHHDRAEVALTSLIQAHEEVVAHAAPEAQDKEAQYISAYIDKMDSLSKQLSVLELQESADAAKLADQKAQAMIDAQAANAAKSAEDFKAALAAVVAQVVADTRAAIATATQAATQAATTAATTAAATAAAATTAGAGGTGGAGGGTGGGGGGGGGGAGAGTTRPRTRLPELELPKFEGSARTYVGWIQQFNAAVHDTDLPEITKFNYLRKAVVGNAAAAIGHVIHQEAFYKEALKVLEERYGRDEIQELQASADLKELPDVSKGAGACDLRSFHDKLRCAAVRAERVGFRIMDLKSGHMGGILEKLPSWLTQKWASYHDKQKKAGKRVDLTDFLEWMDMKIRAKEADDILHGVSTSSKKKAEPQPTASSLNTQASPTGGQGKKNGQNPSTGGGGQGSGNKNNGGPKGGNQPGGGGGQGGSQPPKHPCAKCGGTHKIPNCNAFLALSLENRVAAVNELRLCGKCLVVGHLAKNCNSKASCGTCGGRHHTLLHREGYTRGPGGSGGPSAKGAGNPSSE
jgi:hypothetical protein